jgi:hypothetical protein
MLISMDMLAKILSPILVAIVGGLLKKYLEGRPRLIVYLVHASAHPIPNQILNKMQEPSTLME